MSKKAGAYSQINSFEEIVGEVNGIWKHHHCHCVINVDDKIYQAKILEYDPKCLFADSVSDREYLLTIVEIKNGVEDYKNRLFNKPRCLSWEDCDKATEEFFNKLNKKYVKQKWHHKIYITKAE